MGGDLVVTPQEQFTLGSRQFAQRGTPLHLVAQATAVAGARRYTTLRRAGATAGYSVTTGKVLLITRVLWFHGGAASQITHGYGDDDVGLDSAAAPTNVVIIDAFSTVAFGVLMAAAANTLYDVPVLYSIPAGKFPVMWHANASVLACANYYGYEVDA